MEKVLVTGVAGFIGYHLSIRLLSLGYTVIGVDNMNDYYDIDLKQSRLSDLQDKDEFTFIKLDIADSIALGDLFNNYKPEIVINLAAQAGVRYSITNPEGYIHSNIIGFYNIIEQCRNLVDENMKKIVKHLIFASSSSVYGNSKSVPFSTNDNVDKPISLYAATKKSNELLAYSYANLYGIPMTGLRFFTVYGPFGRPDMAYFSFTNKIIKGDPIKVFNNGELLRDFTYIEDVINAITIIMESLPDKNELGVPYAIYNVGKGKPDKIMDFIGILEECIGKKANIEYLPMQPGDVYTTYADTKDLEERFHTKPSVELKDGLKIFVDWYKEYYNE